MHVPQDSDVCDMAAPLFQHHDPQEHTLVKHPEKVEDSIISSLVRNMFDVGKAPHEGLHMSNSLWWDTRHRSTNMDLTEQVETPQKDWSTDLEELRERQNDLQLTVAELQDKV